MPSKTTTKKASNKGKLKMRFDLANKKVQFFVVIAIVAVLGGGWFTYRSFAASTVVRTWPASDYQVGSGNPSPNTDPNKNTLITSWTLPPNSSINLKQGTTAYVPPGGSATLRLCASVKPVGLGGGSFRFGQRTSPIGVLNIQSFQTYCSPFGQWGIISPDNIWNVGQSTLIVEKAFIDVMNGAPAPAPSK